MKTSLLKVATLALILAGSAWAFQKDAARRSRYTDETYGFSLDATRFPGLNPRTASVPVIFTGPSANGFAPNVNINVQATATTAAAYRDQSKSELKKLGLKVNSDRQLKVSGRDAVEIDYEGSIQGSQNLRFLSLAVIEKDRIVLLTCTSKPDSFPAVEAEFLRSMASLKLK